MAYTGVNYKDAGSTARGGWWLQDYPIVPGIDLAGEIVESESPDFTVGEGVLAHGYDASAPVGTVATPNTSGYRPDYVVPSAELTARGGSGEHGGLPTAAMSVGSAGGPWHYRATACRGDRCDRQGGFDQRDPLQRCGIRGGGLDGSRRRGPAAAARRRQR